MRIQVPVRILNRDHRADRVTEFNPVRLHVRTDSIFVLYLYQWLYLCLVLLYLYLLLYQCLYLYRYN